MFAVPEGKGKLEKISIRISLSYIAPPLWNSEDTIGIFSCPPSLTNGEIPPLRYL